MGLPFSDPLAGDGMGGLLVRVSPPMLVRYLCHHANGFYARQPHHPPSIHLDASKVKKSQFKLVADIQLSQPDDGSVPKTVSSHYRLY